MSAEAIRYAMREHFTAEAKPVNRTVSPDGSSWSDPNFEFLKPGRVRSQLFPRHLHDEIQ